MAEKFYIARAYEMYEAPIQYYFGSLELAKSYLINEVNDEDSTVRYSTYIDIIEMTLQEDGRYDGRGLGVVNTDGLYVEDMVSAIEAIK